MNAYEIPTLNREGLAGFIIQSPNMGLDGRLEFFYNLYPYAEDIPGSLFILDSDYYVLASNQCAWKQIKLDNINELIGHTTSEVEQKLGWPESMVGRANKDDKLVLQQGHSIHHETILVGDHEHVLLCKKEAIYADNGKPLGILGFSVPIQMKHKRINWNKKQNHIIISLTPEQSISITAREFVILQGILHGKSSNEIAIVNLISPKTVETYVMRLKSKLGCVKQREIIPMLVKYDIANALLEYTFH